MPLSACTLTEPRICYETVFSPLITLTFTAFVIATFAPAPSATVQGTLINTRCYSRNNEDVENAHVVKTPEGAMRTIESCATTCANMGIPAAILKDGEAGADTYVILAPERKWQLAGS